MAKEFFPEEDENAAQKKSSQQRLLLLLLLLIILFAYLYFFTGLIKPRGEQASAPTPPPAPAVVKKPLPPRPNAAEAPAAKPAEATPGKPAEAGKPAAAPAAAPAKPEAAAKPAAPAAKPEAAAKPAAPTTPAKPAPAKEAKAAPAKEAKPAPAKEAKAAPAKEAKPAAPAKQAKAAPAKEAKPAAAKEAKAAAAVEAKPAAKTATKAKVAKSAATSPKGGFALELDNDLAESEIPAVTNKLKKAGLTRVVTIKSHKGEPMHRLFLADFGNHDEAAEELGRLKGVAPNAFMLKESGRYAVYAGSFMREGKAAVEQDRLYDKGVRLVLKKANIPVTVVKVRAGSFPDPTSAEKAAASLKKSGLTAKVVKAGK